MKTDIDGYPTICSVCDKPIVKKHHSSQQHFDHNSQQATSWHIECSSNSHPFFCKGKHAHVELIMGSWFCTECGLKVDWVIT